ncbi:unnamed protein product [Paramecium sonneborni]|uniref:RBR-type E3 ubiquitin transferase n=1 Tax=Paramecium sonneborni TaxID=65129 RepID=A0A8S1RBQ1_9CILI|nr:unnamed protein product [Paramecium sonneborni]
MIVNNLNQNVEEETKQQKDQSQITINDAQKELIQKLHIEQQIPLFTSVYIVILKNCQNQEQANELYKNITASDHDYIQSKQSDNCVICHQKQNLHQSNLMNYSTCIQIFEELNYSIRPKMTCSICFELRIEDQIVKFNQIMHNICEQCFTMNLITQIQSGHVQNLKCPHCNEYLSEDIILKYAQQVKEKYLKFKNNISVITSNDRMWCPNNECQKIVIFQTSKNFEKCQYCQIEYCKNCRQKSHPNLSCKDNLTQFIGLPENNNERLVQCPRCKFLVEKIDGCVSITCSYCKCQWCWGCCKELTILHPFYCPHFMPCYDEKKCWTKFVLIFWYFWLLILAFFIGLFFFQIVLFQLTSEKSCYIQSKCWIKVVINILISLLGIVILPITTALYLISLLPLCIIFLIIEWYDGQKIKQSRQSQTIQQNPQSN